MGIKKYTATKDTTITDSYKPGLISRASGSNMGAADSLEVFKIYGQQASSSIELSRALLQFPTTNMTTDRAAGTIPASGSVNFVLRLFNAEHPFTLPSNYIVSVNQLSRSWDEGEGLDLDEYKDTGQASWASASTTTTWSTIGGDFLTGSDYSFTFTEGMENLELDVTGMVEEWLAGTQTDYGMLVKMSGTYETDETSYYTKKFYARSSEYELKRPLIEARWDGSVKDDRGNFYRSSSVASAANNLNTLYFYNYVRGELANLPNIGSGEPIYVSVYDTRAGTNSLAATPQNPVTGGWAATGIYSASFALAATATTVYDRWYSGSNVYHTGAVEVDGFGEYASTGRIPRFIVNVSDLKASYFKHEEARFRVFTRKSPRMNNVWVANAGTVKPDIIPKLYYKIVRVADNEEVINYGTGTTLHTKLSYDASGSYFDLDMSQLHVGYMYSMKFVRQKESGDFMELPTTFKFRVHEEDWE